MKTFVAIVVVLVLVSGGYVLMKRSNAQTSIETMMQNDTSLTETRLAGASTSTATTSIPTTADGTATTTRLDTSASSTHASSSDVQ